jgi:hypothetical protein
MHKHTSAVARKIAIESA